MPQQTSSFTPTPRPPAPRPPRSSGGLMSVPQGSQRPYNMPGMPPPRDPGGPVSIPTPGFPPRAPRPAGGQMSTPPTGIGNPNKPPGWYRARHPREVKSPTASTTTVEPVGYAFDPKAPIVPQDNTGPVDQPVPTSTVPMDFMSYLFNTYPDIVKMYPQLFNAFQTQSQAAPQPQGLLLPPTGGTNLG